MSSSALHIMDKNMARKAIRHRQILKVQPLSFSPFARSVARIASAYKVKRQFHDFKKRAPLIKSELLSGNGFIGHSLKEKNKQSESSQEEEFEVSSRSEEEFEGSSQSDSSDKEEFEGFVQADFAFFDPKPDDFHGVKILLQSYLDTKQWDIGGFVDLILGQTTVGTVVKIEESDDAGLFAVVSSLNLGRYKDCKCIMEIKDFLLSVCQEKHIAVELNSLIEEKAHHVGLLLSQRVVNLPPQLLPHLYDALFDEISWATEDEPTEELRNSFRFRYYLIISQIYKHKNANKRRPTSGSDEALIYIHPEDEIFHKLSSWSFDFTLNGQQPAIEELKSYRKMGLVIAVEAGKVPTFREELQSFIDDS